MVIGAFCGAFSSAISGAVGSIGSALATFASGVGTVIGNLVTAIPPIAETLGKFASAFLQGLGILKPDEKLGKLGECALQAAENGITLDQFDNFADYMDALRNFDLDPDKAEKRSYAEKLVAGLGVGTVAMERKFSAAPGSLDSLWLLPIVNPGYFTPERMLSIVGTGRLTGDIWAYLDKRLSAGDSGRLEESLAAGVGQDAPNAGGKEQLFEALDQARDKWEALGRQIEGDKEA
jgi:hypothetical protein